LDKLRLQQKAVIHKQRAGRTVRQWMSLRSVLQTDFPPSVSWHRHPVTVLFDINSQRWQIKFRTEKWRTK